MINTKKIIMSLATAAFILGFSTTLNAVVPTQTGQEMIDNSNRLYSGNVNNNPNPQLSNPDRVYSNPNQGVSRTYDLGAPNQTYYNYYPEANPYYTRQGYTAPPPAPIYGYGYYGSLPPPTPNQAFPDKAQADALYNHIRSR